MAAANLPPFYIYEDAGLDHTGLLECVPSWRFDDQTAEASMLHLLFQHRPRVPASAGGGLAAGACSVRSTTSTRALPRTQSCLAARLACAALSSALARFTDNSLAASSLELRRLWCTGPRLPLNLLKSSGICGKQPVGNHWESLLCLLGGPASSRSVVCCAPSSAASC